MLCSVVFHQVQITKAKGRPPSAARQSWQQFAFLCSVQCAEEDRSACPATHSCFISSQKLCAPDRCTGAVCGSRLVGRGDVRN
eukprot:6172386-Pleurochrysis_carterae.AAC.4